MSSRSLPLLAAACLASCSFHAFADSNPWSLGAALSLGHDSNIRRAPDAAAVSDTLVTASVLGRLDLPFGRERLVVDATLDRNHFNSHSELDNNSYSLTGKLDFETGDRVYGTLYVDSRQAAFNYDPNGSGNLTALNQERNSRLGLKMRVGVVTRWTLEGNLEAQRRDESDPAFAYRELDRQAVDAGVRYQPSPDLTLGALVRHAWGSYPNIGGGDDFRRSDVEASASWRASGASTVDLRLTFSDENHDLAAVRSASQWSGAVRWQWQPTGKLSFSLRAARDSDTGASDQNILGATLTNSDARQRTSLDLGASWAVSAKWRLDGQLSYSRRSLDSQLQALAARSGRDSTQVARLGLVFMPSRQWETGCRVMHEQRDVSGDSLNLTYAYSADVVSCYLQFMLN